MPHISDMNSSASSHGSTGNKAKYHRTSSSSSVSAPRVLSPTLGRGEDTVKFPRIDECAHFHYETVEYGSVKITVLDEAPDGTRVNGNLDSQRTEQALWVKVGCQDNEWIIRRFTQQFKNLDELLHECVYDRRFSRLPSLSAIEQNENEEALHKKLQRYMQRLSELPENQMACAPVLHWFDMDNKGRNLVAALRETADINIPAVAAAHAVRRYTSQSVDELSLEVGDMVSIIDMGDTNWWRGKCKLRVGSFPSQCVRRINDAKQADEVVPLSPNLPSSPTSTSPPLGTSFNKTKPIVKKHGKFMEFLRSFLLTRPSKSRLKQSGILKERVFGCDLGEYLHNCGDEVPAVIRDCTDFIEKHGVVDGIYRISGVSSHVQNLRHEYDCERRPNLNRDPGGRGEQSLCDPHSVAGLCKLYFRELPNPLLTYQLYNRFAEAINAAEQERLLRIHDVIQQLPPPHYRTLKHLAIHLQVMAQAHNKTSMHCRNLAIVWAPNLLRSRDLEAGLAAFTEARVQSVVTEFLISNADLLFSEKLQNMQYDASRGQKPPRPKSLMVLSAPKLISLAEAQARSKGGGRFFTRSSSNYTNDSDDTSRRNDSTDVYRRKSSSPPSNQPTVIPGQASSAPIDIVPLGAGVHSIYNKRRQSMDPKLTGSRPQPSFPSNPRHYASQHGGWRSKLGSFLKKGGPQGANDSHNNKPLVKVALRRSQSDDSLLSAHSSRQDINKIGSSMKTHITEESLDLGESPFPLRPTMRQTHQSPRRSPRPIGRIFNPADANGDAERLSTSPPTTQTLVGDARRVGDINGSKTPDSICTTSSTVINSSSPFSGMSSNFPDIMGDAGLDFDPLHFGPPSSPTKETRTLADNDPDSPTHFDVQKTGGHEPKYENNSSDDLNGRFGSAVSKTGDQNGGHLAPRSDELNPKYEDIFNANVRLLKITGSENNGAVENARSGGEKLVSGAVNCDLITQKQENNNNNQAISAAKENVVPQIPGHVTTAVSVGYDVAGKTHSAHTAKKKPQPPANVIRRPVDLPVGGDYSVHYTCQTQTSNGRTRQSITATFVQDRISRDHSVRQPHSIVRSMDVPPTLHGSHHQHNKHARKQHSYHIPVTKRQHALMAVASLHQKDGSRTDRRAVQHTRSLSAGDELDRRGKRHPVPLPRSASISGSRKPVPLPRRRILGETEKISEIDEVDASTECWTVSAPATPLNEFQAESSEFSNIQTITNSSFAPDNSNVQCLDGNYGDDQREGSHCKARDNGEESKHKQLTKASSSTDIVSPTDSICASTVLSWV